MERLNTIQVLDCIEGLKRLPDDSVDCCVTDPPYGIRFMSKRWDYDIPPVEVWREVLRVLKPGAHMLVACGTRTQHKMASNIEEAGFEIRDVITWHYGQGFPKSLDIAKAMDRLEGADREVIGTKRTNVGMQSGNYANRSAAGMVPITVPASDNAKKWSGWGTALKPATEFWTLARKPIAEDTIAENMLRFNTGGLHIDACRIPVPPGDDPRLSGNGSWNTGQMAKNTYGDGWTGDEVVSSELGRFPANVILDESAAQAMDEQSGSLRSGKPMGKKKAVNKIYGPLGIGHPLTGYGDTGGASRFFYVAKADAKERGEGNTHATVKPLALMQYLIKLVCPAPGVVLEPFAGSGTTCIAARQQGRDFIAFEINPEYAAIAEQRMKDLLGLFYPPADDSPKQP